jgi:hypothetical protein
MTIKQCLYYAFFVGTLSLTRMSVSQECCSVPVSETSRAVGWYQDPPSKTIAGFSATVTDQYGTSFDGRVVYERTYATGSNSCYYPGSALLEHPYPAGSGWTLASGQAAGQHNTYGYDAVGYPPDVVGSIIESIEDYFVGDGCDATIYQSMIIDCDRDYAAYWDNVLNYVVYRNHVVASRDTASLTLYLP